MSFEYVGDFEECGFTVGVDSGQAGIFDFNTCRND